jgi:hypothetical protein
MVLHSLDYLYFLLSFCALCIPFAFDVLVVNYATIQFQVSTFFSKKIPLESLLTKFIEYPILDLPKNCKETHSLLY